MCITSCYYKISVQILIFSYERVLGCAESVVSTFVQPHSPIHCQISRAHICLMASFPTIHGESAGGIDLEETPPQFSSGSPGLRTSTKSELCSRRNKSVMALMGSSRLTARARSLVLMRIRSCKSALLVGTWPAMRSETPAHEVAAHCFSWTCRRGFSTNRPSKPEGGLRTRIPHMPLYHCKVGDRQRDLLVTWSFRTGRCAGRYFTIIAVARLLSTSSDIMRSVFENESIRRDAVKKGGAALVTNRWNVPVSIKETREGTKRQYE